MKSADFHPLFRWRCEYDVDSDIEEGVCVFVLVLERYFEHFACRDGAGVLCVGHFKVGLAGILRGAGVHD
jgi:hypothetical protein